MANRVNTLLANVSLRPAGDDDREFLLSVYGSSRSDEIDQAPWTDDEKQAFLRMQFEAQDAYYRQVYPDATFDVIERGGLPIGRLYVARLAGEIRIIDIAVLAEHRGRGAGTEVLAGILAEADAARARVSLHVEPWNPARRLYQRLGFRTVRTADVYELMERPASVS